MPCAKILYTGLVAGLVVAASEAAATPTWRDSVDLPASIGGSVQAQLRQGWLHAWMPRAKNCGILSSAERINQAGLKKPIPLP